MLKSFVLALAALVLSAGYAAAGELYVYSGAGLRPAIQPLADRFEKETGDKVIIEYGGMGDLLTRFAATGRGDVFVSGTKFYSDKLEAQNKIADVRSLVLHTAVIGVRADKASTITSLDDLAKPGIRIALGDAKAMALGRTADLILDASGLGDKIRANVVVRGTTLQQVALYIVNGDVDAGIVGSSTIASSKGKLVGIEIPAKFYQPEEITIGILDTVADQPAAEAFENLVSGPDGIAAFTKAGFVPLPH